MGGQNPLLPAQQRGKPTVQEDKAQAQRHTEHYHGANPQDKPDRGPAGRLNPDRGRTGRRIHLQDRFAPPVLSGMHVYLIGLTAQPPGRAFLYPGRYIQVRIGTLAGRTFTARRAVTLEERLWIGRKRFLGSRTAFFLLRPGLRRAGREYLDRILNGFWRKPAGSYRAFNGSGPYKL